MNVRPTIRLRLTLLFASLFAASSAVLITTAYLFVANRPFGRRSFEASNERLQEAFLEAGLPAPTALTPEDGVRPTRGQLPPEVSGVLNQLSDDARQEVLNDLLSQSIIAFLITASASVVLAWWVAGRALRPVDQITDAANRFSEDNLDHRLPDDGPDDELHRLRSSFNAMLDRLQEGFDARRRFAADASHELRTPLAVLRSRADNVLANPEGQGAEALALDVRTEVDRADRLVEALLALARAEQATSAPYETFDFADLVGDVVGYLAPEADRGGIEIELELGDAPLAGDKVLLRQLVINLVRNAIVHNRSGGWISVSADSTPTSAELTVSNSGDLIDDDDIEGLFRRFQRGTTASDDSRGHGLGLAIVEAVARVHGATVVPSARAEGGLMVLVSLPTLFD